MTVNLSRNLLDNRHPQYAAMSPDWIFWAQSYNGGQEYTAAKHLFKFCRETDGRYSARLKRADRNNFTKQILDLVIQYLFKEAPARKHDKASQAIQDFWEDVDGKGTQIDDFARQLGTNVGLYGFHYVVVDKPPEIAVTKAEQQAKGLKPYAYFVSPVDVFDVVFDDKTGHITQILIREYTRGVIDLRNERENDNLQERFRLWFKDPVSGAVTWTLYKKDKDGKPVVDSQGAISLERIPIAKVTRGDSTYGGSSIVGDVATLDRSVYNYNSLCDEILYDQTFSILRLPWDGKAQEFYDEWGLVLSTKSVLPYPKDAAMAPDYISPDASQGELILKRIDQKTNQIFKLQNLQDTVGRTVDTQKTGGTNSAQSGIAKAYDFEKLNAGLGEFGDVLEKGEEAIAELVNLWEGETDAMHTDLIDYPDTFNIKSMVQELMEYNMLSTAVNSERFRKILEKNLVKKATPKLEEKDFIEIMDEIETSQSPAMVEAEQNAAANSLRTPANAPVKPKPAGSNKAV